LLYPVSFAAQQAQEAVELLHSTLPKTSKVGVPTPDYQNAEPYL
jgi:hypothetical protein